MGQRPVRISKYCVGLAVVHPHLPANRWNRTLRRYFEAHDALPDQPLVSAVPVSTRAPPRENSRPPFASRGVSDSGVIPV